MATSKQEQLYNEIIEYYNYAARLIKTIEDSSDSLAQEQFEVVEKAVLALEECTDKLATEYIDFIKSGESAKAIETARETLNEIDAKVEECRNRILMLYDRKAQGENVN